MAVDRDALRDIFDNFDEKYDKIIGPRGRKLINQYATKRLKFPSDREMRKITSVPHTWKVGDKYWKLAQTHYGDSELWWLIAWFNQKPTENHCRNGDTIMIPFPLERIYKYFGL